MVCFAQQVVLTFLLGIGLAGCASLDNDVQQSNTLVTAVAALTQAETALYDQIIAVSAATQRIAFERSFVTKDRNADDTVGQYSASPPEEYAKAKALRLQVLSQLGNYAEQINAIATSSSTAWPASEATTTVSDTEKLVGKLGAAVNPNDVTTATGVINDLASAITASESASQIQTLATAAEPSIEKIQTMITNDNDIINIGVVQGLIPAQQIDEREILRSLYNESSGPAARLQIAQSLASALPAITTLSNAQQLVIDAIKKIVGANQALAAKNNQSAKELINEAVSIANQAITTSKSASPSTK